MGLKDFFMRLVLLLMLTAFVVKASAQKKPRPYRCGFTPDSFKGVRHNYENYAVLFGCKPGERIASVGAQSGAVEMGISCFTDSLRWTLQDTNAMCLNADQLAKVKAHFQSLKGDSIQSSFEIVIGTEAQTNLPVNTFDRIILSNVFHELTAPDSTMRQLHAAMNQNAVLVISEAFARKPGERRKPCNHRKTDRTVFLQSMTRWGFQPVSETMDGNRHMSVLQFKKTTP